MDLPLGLAVADNTVVLDGVHPKLMDFLGQLAPIHKLLFGIDLVVTSGKDGHHVAGSLHMLGRAVDLRTHDKSPDEVTLLLHVLSFSTVSLPIAVFDERNVPPSPHLHLEWHGV